MWYFWEVRLGEGEPIGYQIVQIRTNLGMTRGELCSKANVHPRTMKRLEAGAERLVDWGVLLRIFKVFGMQIDATFKASEATDEKKEI